MIERFESVAIIGTGLLGASLGLALKQHQLVKTVHGVGRRTESLDIAKERGAIDHGHLDPKEPVAASDLIVVCTPAASVPAMLDLIREHADSNAVTTDVTSTKGAICKHAANTWPSPRRFVGSHPMAGSENFGPEHATADLYKDRVVLIESGRDLDSEALSSVRSLWSTVGARLVDVDPVEHDRLLARTSHVPHIAASAVAMLSERMEITREFAGGGLRDITRVAAGRPELWRDICLTNAESVSAALDDLVANLQQFKAALGNPEELDRLFEAGRDARLHLFGDRNKDDQ